MPEEMLLDDGVDAEDISEALAEEVKRFSEIHLRLKAQLEAAEEELRTTRSTAEKTSIEKKDLQMHLVVAKDEAKIKDEESKEKIAELQKLLGAVQQVGNSEIGHMGVCTPTDTCHMITDLFLR